MKTENPIDFSEVKKGMNLAVKRVRGGHRIRHRGIVVSIDPKFVTLDLGDSLYIVNLDPDQSGMPTADFYEVTDE